MLSVYEFVESFQQPREMGTVVKHMKKKWRPREVELVLKVTQGVSPGTNA